ncbi:hypothetical protein Thiowin_04401 [Thiorhodovibrio winogradskyi]|uniref:Uncharacterized protein n=1 Tax=Thiorhodovibrio winogradskyi TaxID=77007 RepID=A0ABZ0SFI9_9GAMM|nr:DUF3782 domain-containing protein [Thiorhodovibrio winogradskyi]
MMIEPNTELTPVMRQQVMAMIDKRVTENPVSYEDFSEVKAVMAELAHAQERTETRVEELACQMAAGFKQLGDQIAELGGRWGIHNEGAFRATIHAVLSKIDGIEVREGDHGDRQADIITHVSGFKNRAPIESSLCLIIKSGLMDGRMSSS